MLNLGDAVVPLSRWVLEVLVALHSLAKTRPVLQMKNFALRHQLAVLQRTTAKRPRLNASDRLLWIWISRLCSDWRSWLVIVEPETVVGWYRKLFRAAWTWKVRRGKVGRPAVSKNTRELIRRMSRENQRGELRVIHGELLKGVVSRVLCKRVLFLNG